MYTLLIPTVTPLPSFYDSSFLNYHNHHIFIILLQVVHRNHCKFFPSFYDSSLLNYHNHHILPFFYKWFIGTTIIPSLLYIRIDITTIIFLMFSNPIVVNK